MVTGGIEVLLLSLALLFNFVGLAALAGLAIIALSVPLNAWLNRGMKRLQGRIMQRCVVVSRWWCGCVERLVLHVHTYENETNKK